MDREVNYMIITEKFFQSKNRNGEFLNYLFFSPEKHNAKLPLIISIHGAGWRGNDLSIINLRDGNDLLMQIYKGLELDSFVVAPQCHCDTWFELYDVLLEFIDAMRNDEHIDIDRVYLTGSSMGGYTVWQLAMTKPHWFAALIPVCGGGMYWNAERLKNMPVWAFHGALDKTVLPDESIKMISAINENGGNAKITIFPDVSHNAWDYTYTDDVLKWMFEQKRCNNDF